MLLPFGDHVSGSLMLSAGCSRERTTTDEIRDNSNVYKGKIPCNWASVLFVWLPFIIWCSSLLAAAKIIIMSGSHHCPPLVVLHYYRNIFLHPTCIPFPAPSGSLLCVEPHCVNLIIWSQCNREKGLILKSQACKNCYFNLFSCICHGTTCVLLKWLLFLIVYIVSLNVLSSI